MIHVHALHQRSQWGGMSSRNNKENRLEPLQCNWRLKDTLGGWLLFRKTECFCLTPSFLIGPVVGRIWGGRLSKEPYDPETIEAMQKDDPEAQTRDDPKDESWDGPVGSESGTARYRELGGRNIELFRSQQHIFVSGINNWRHR